MEKITIAAVGDISFHGRESTQLHDAIHSSIKTHFKNSDIVIGNLEGPFISGGQCTPGKCVLGSDPSWVKDLYNSGFDVVSLANNHVMDYGPDGLRETIDSLKRHGIAVIGAGVDLHDANQPFYMSIKNRRLAFLARSSVIVSSPCYATIKTPGVAFLDMKELKTSISRCKDQADNIILSIHWGIEHYLYPSSSQRDLARELIRSGADLIIGHHPHVLQGVEKIGKGMAAYSLGNFIFDDIRWSFTDKEGGNQDRLVTLTDENRKTCVLIVKLSEEDIFSYDFIPAIIKPDCIIEIDEDTARVKQYHRLCSRLSWPFYKPLWKLYSIKQEWVLRVMPMLKGKFTWQKLKKLRLKHLRELIYKMRRSAKISMGKTTNPYE